MVDVFRVDRSQGKKTMHLVWKAKAVEAVADISHCEAKVAFRVVVAMGVKVCMARVRRTVGVAVVVVPCWSWSGVGGYLEPDQAFGGDQVNTGRRSAHCVSSTSVDYQSKGSIPLVHEEKRGELDGISGPSDEPNSP